MIVTPTIPLDSDAKAVRFGDFGKTTQILSQKIRIIQTQI